MGAEPPRETYTHSGHVQGQHRQRPHGLFGGRLAGVLSAAGAERGRRVRTGALQRSRETVSLVPRAALLAAWRGRQRASLVFFELVHRGKESCIRVAPQLTAPLCMGPSWFIAWLSANSFYGDELLLRRPAPCQHGFEYADTSANWRGKSGHAD